MSPEPRRTRRASISAALSIATTVGLGGCDRGPPPRAAVQAKAAPVPPGSVVAPAPPRMTSAEVDARLLACWRAAGVAPTPPADDAAWLRRVWIDVVGTIPPPEVVRRFMAETESGTRRARAIDELLASPRWADHWTAYWDDAWMGREPRRQDVDAGAFRGWLHDALARNEPWNEVVTQLLTATGRNSAGEPKRDAEANDGRDGVAEGVNGAVNWTLRYQESPEDMAGAASRTLLGVQIQCAQCHDHKTEKWTQKDFQAFAAAFVRTRLTPVDGKHVGAKGTVRRVDLTDLGRPAPRFAKKMADVDAIAKARPAAIDGTDLGDGDGVRAALARWVTAPQNPWFARAFVNRMWGHFLGRGFVDPVDDLRPSNPPVAPDLFADLAADFVASGYDVKHLVRVIVGTAAYAASAAPLDAATAKVDPDATLWERFRVTPLGPEELLDAVIAATKLDAIVERTGRLDLAQVRARVRQRYGFLFDVDEESDQSDYVGTIAQGLALLDGSVVATGASVLPGSVLADVLAMAGDDASRIDELYLRTLSRLPAPEEVARWTRFVQSGTDTPEPALSVRGSDPPGPPDPLRGLEVRAGRQRADARARAYEDLLWTLLNSSEFVFNH
jgi:hypothetical protein